MQLLKPTVALATLLASLAANASFIINGSFEDHPAFPAQNWNYFTAGQVPGWNPAGGSTVIEIGRATVYGVTGQDGLDVLELDSKANVTVAQVLASPGAPMTVSFLYALRKNVAPASGTLEVLWNNVVVASLSPTLQAMQPYSLNVVSIGGANTLSFRGTGTSDSYGALIDKVVVVPEPSTYIAAALLGLPLAFSAMRRHMAKKA